MARLGRVLVVLALLAFVCCALLQKHRSDTEELHRLQRESLTFAIRAGGPMPPPASPAELEAIAGVVAAASPEEAELLQETYGEEPDLLVYATRDSDGDGIHDFRVGDFHGKFFEGDVDLDGDGVRNVLDAAPYDPGSGGRDLDGDGAPDPGSFPDANGNGLPDPVDWALDGRRPAAAEQQRLLFAEHGVLLVDRSAEFTDTLTRSVYDVMARVLRTVPRDQLPALRVVAAEEEALLFPEVDEETNAMMIAQTQTLVVYRSGIELSAFAQLGLLLHELGHGYQSSLDFEGIDAENRRVFVPAPRFLERVARFGWTYEPLTPEDRFDPPALFTPQYLLVEPSYAWRGEPTEAWAEWMEALYAEVGDGYLEDTRVTELGIVGDYSLVDPWEWHSDSVLAYLFVEIERWLAEHPDASPADTEQMRQAAAEAWPSFRYVNLDPKVRGHFRGVLPLRDSDLAYFAKAYVEPLSAGE